MKTIIRVGSAPVYCTVTFIIRKKTCGAERVVKDVQGVHAWRRLDEPTAINGEEKFLRIQKYFS